MLAPMHAKGDVGKVLRRMALVGALAVVRAMGESLGKKLADALWPEDEEEGDDDGDEQPQD